MRWGWSQDRHGCSIIAWVWEWARPEKTIVPAGMSMGCMWGWARLTYATAPLGVHESQMGCEMGQVMGQYLLASAKIRVGSRPGGGQWGHTNKVPAPAGVFER